MFLKTLKTVTLNTLLFHRKLLGLILLIKTILKRYEIKLLHILSYQRRGDMLRKIFGGVKVAI